MFSDYLKAIIQYCLPKKLITTLAGAGANIKQDSFKNFIIRHFISQYGVNMAEAQFESPEDFATFNDFFIRELKPGIRPISSATVVSPVDGRISEIGRIHQGTLVQAKGRDYTVHELLASSKEQSDRFAQGLFATLYLSPKDYHRVHMPIEATLKEMVYVPGQLFSVQPATARMIPKLFARNERLVVYFDTALGPMAMVLVGATIVGAINTSWHGDIQRGREIKRFIYSDNHDMNTLLAKAQEMGFFKLGSTVVLLFADSNQLQWHGALQAGDPIQMGAPLANIRR